MTHMITISGAEYHFSGPGALSPEGRPVRIKDIAHHLALINRFTGATSRPYSVAEHSLLCAEIGKRLNAPVSLQMALLMHDAHEAYTTDLSSPAKIAVNCYSAGAGGLEAWGMFEYEHAKTVRRHFGLLSSFAAHKDKIRQIDLMALATERRDLTAWRAGTSGPWGILGDGAAVPVPAADWVDLASPGREALSWKFWRDHFLERFHELRAEVSSDHQDRVSAARSAC